MEKYQDISSSEDAIIVENVSKHFRIPHEKKTRLFEHIVGTIKGTTSTYEEFWALKDVSFTVKKGEALAIAPFLELGVGFNPELTTEDNVRLYGAIMGMGKKEMEDKFEEIFEFAELSRFRNMKLKNLA
ncbi:MAG: hypothetical protein Q7J35_01955 [Candidatus Methanoperedens sp.]|nr:hypothetical protein [Candidatus Methanoperedens sp.]